MSMPVTLAFYIGRRFLRSVLIGWAGFSVLASTFDYLNLMHQLAGHAGIWTVLGITALRAPWLMIQILPFVILISGIFCFWRLARASELLVARSFGISVWQYLSTTIVSAILLGFFAMMVLNPLSAVLMSRAGRLINSYENIQIHQGISSYSAGQLWLRQPDNGLVPGGAAILYVQGAVFHHGELSAGRTSLFRLAKDGKILAEIEAQSVVLEDRTWHLYRARVFSGSAVAKPAAVYLLPTKFTAIGIEDSLLPATGVSFWALPRYIRVGGQIGFNVTALRLRFQYLLSLPLLYAAMALLAAAFSVRFSQRFGGVSMISAGIVAGFAVFALSQITGQLGRSGFLPVFLAAWVPASVALLVALTLLLHFEDG